MRIGFVTWKFPVLSEPFVSTLALDLLATGQDVRLLTFDTQDEGCADGMMHPDVARSDLLSRIGRACASPSLGSLRQCPVPPLALMGLLLPGKALGRARLVLREGAFDVVHCHFANLGLAANGLRQAGLLRTRALVVHIRGYDITHFVEDNGRHIYRDLFRQADLFIANCRHFRDRAIALGCPPDKILVIGSPIDCSLFAPPLHRQPYENRPLRLVAVGRLVEKKGFGDAIAAVGLLRQRGLDVVLDIFGEGHLRPSLERQAAELGLGARVICHGQATRDRIVAALHASDIALAPSIRSPSGNEDAPVNTLKEAMATGLPVVATRHGGIPELVVHQENGMLVSESSPPALAHAIANLAGRPHDWPRMGEAGRARVLAEYDRTSVCQRTLSAYRACIEGPMSTSVVAGFNDPITVATR